MAMSVGDKSDDTPMSDINTTPLVDVMLVLLIIFLIAVPVVVQNVKLQLPERKFIPTTTKPENVSLSVLAQNGTCKVFWGLSPVTFDELKDRAVTKLKADVARLGPNASIDDMPEAHIRGDVNTPYRCVGGVVFAMQSAGYPRVGFISQPPANGG
jgi:biopolymer transport protein ExbD